MILHLTKNIIITMQELPNNEIIIFILTPTRHLSFV